MATVYFTNSAAVGTGSILNAIRLAKNNDVVMPDPNVFPAGQRIDINLTSALDLTKSLTFDGSERRFRLVAASYTCLIASDSTGSDDFAATDVEFVGAVRKEGGTARYVRCCFYGGKYSSHLVLFSDGAVGTMEDCVVAGSRSGGVRPVSSTVTIYRSTLAGNYGGDAVPNTTAYAPTYVDTIANVVPSTVGFVNPPPDSIALPSGNTALPWETWNLRLRSESPYATGATSEGTVDVDGNLRVSGGALGAYEALEGVAWSADGATLTLTSAKFNVFNFAPATVNLSGVNFVGKLQLQEATTLNFQGALKVEEFYPGDYATTLSGTGLFVVPSEADLTNVAESVGIVITDSGADVSALSAVATANDAVQISGVQADEEIPVVLEYQDSAGAWQTLSAATVLTSAPTTFAVPKGTTQYRAFDGEKFVYDAAWWGVAAGVQFSVVAEVVAAAEIGQNWQCVFEVIGVDSDNIVRVGQAVTILARVFDAFDDSAPLLNTGSNVSAIRYSCERKTKEIFSTVWEPVTGHSNVAVPATALLENVQSGDAWSVDQSGYNFSMTPDTTTNPLFPEVGEYRIVVTIQLATGNPVVFYVFVSVVDSAN